jgi:hypothetical protein
MRFESFVRQFVEVGGLRLKAAVARERAVSIKSMRNVHLSHWHFKTSFALFIHSTLCEMQDSTVILACLYCELRHPKQKLPRSSKTCHLAPHHVPPRQTIRRARPTPRPSKTNCSARPMPRIRIFVLPSPIPDKM